MNLKQPVSPTLPLDGWRAAENFAAWHMVHALGFIDAAMTPLGTDGGLDVVASGAAGQVKHHVQPVGRPDLQRLRGASVSQRVPVFYALSGYTTGALAFAESTSLPLFAYTLEGRCRPVNDAARDLLETAQMRSLAIAERRRERDEARERREQERAAEQEREQRFQDELAQTWRREIDAMPATHESVCAYLDGLKRVPVSLALEQLALEGRWGDLADLLEGPTRSVFLAARLAHARVLQLVDGVTPKYASMDYGPAAVSNALEVIDQLAAMCREPEPDKEAIARLIAANERRLVAVVLDARRKSARLR